MDDSKHESPIVDAERAAEDDIQTCDARPLHEFFTRREHVWQRKDRSKYTRHVGAQQQLRAQMGISRAEARDADHALRTMPKAFTVLPEEGE